MTAPAGTSSARATLNHPNGIGNGNLATGGIVYSSLSRALMANDRVYIHEFIDIIGHKRAAYMHHMTANWSPEGQEQRNQLCYGVWAVLGSTGRWPEVVNIWEHDSWDGLAASFGTE